MALGVSTAGSADPRIAVIVLVAARGACAGDNLSYGIGRRFSARIERRVFASARGKRRRAWAGRSLDRYGARLVVVCRFLPGGRTAVTITCGILGFDRRRFVPATAAAGVIWASYAFAIGRLGGNTFEDRPWAGLLLALAIALAISVLVDAVRRPAAAQHVVRRRDEPGRLGGCRATPESAVLGAVAGDVGEAGAGRQARAQHPDPAA